MSPFEDIPVRSNSDLTADASWWNTIRTFLVARFPNSQGSDAGISLTNNQSTLADLTGLLLDSDTYTDHRIRYRIQRSTSLATYKEVGTILAWWDGSAWNYKRSVDYGNALGDGAGSEAGDYQVGGSDSIQINSSTGQAEYLSHNMSGTGHSATFDWYIEESWAA